MLKSGETSTVTFKVNVMGTSMEPRVRVHLDIDAGVLLFDASRIDDETWSANLQIPKTIKSGNYKLSVEVVLNNRIFRPVSQMVRVEGFDEVAVELPIEKPSAPAETKTQNVVRPSISSALLRDFEGNVPGAPIVRQPYVEQVKEKPKPVQPVKSESYVIPNPPDLKALEKRAKKKLIPRLESGFPTMPIKTTKFSIKDIVSEAEKIPTAATISSTTLPTRKKESTIRLVKEELIYE